VAGSRCRLESGCLASGPVRRNDLGGVSVEYTLLMLFIAVAMVVSLMFFGDAVLGLFRAGTDQVPWSPIH
jgi:Flp pilus assembly pilin Flp